jgi:cell wall-associated NlpC family hydrolase
VACTALCVLIARPAYADPAGTGTIPDPGVPVPAVAGLPTSGQTPAPTGVAPPGPLGQQILTKRAQVEALGEQVKHAQLDLEAAQQAVTTTYEAWQRAATNLKDLQRKAGSAAAQAYKDATALGPFDAYASDLHQLGMLAPGLGDGARGGPAGSEGAAAEVARTQREVTNDYAAYQTALALAQQRGTDVATLRTSHDQQQAALTQLTSNNTQQVAAADASLEAQNRALAGQFGPGTAVNGMVANPKAIAAMRAAMTRLGDPYVWGAEGPHQFDCSGLVYWAYQQVGVNSLPRVANDQFHATAQISPSDLLPGDLVFFSTTSKTDWTTISHVGMYVGDGKMIEAPTTGDVVKIATVWWSAFFGATRVVPAVPAPPPPPAPKPPAPKPPAPPPSPSPSPTPKPTPSTPSPAPTHSTPPPSKSPSSAPPSSPASPSTSASRSASASASSSRSAAASGSASARR